MAKKKKGKQGSRKKSRSNINHDKTQTTLGPDDETVTMEVATASNTVANTAAATTQATTTQPRPSLIWWDDHIARLLRMFVAGALGAAILSILVWVLSLGLFNINPMVVPPGATVAQQLSPSALLVAVLIPALGAAFVYFIMDKLLGERTWRVFLIVAAVLAILSLIPVFALPVSTGSKVVLSLMHIASTLGILWGIRYTLGYFPKAINRWAAEVG